MADFSLRALPNVVLGSHALSRLGQIIPRWTGGGEKRFMLVSDPVLRDFGIEEKVLQSFKDSGIEAVIFDQMPASSSEVVGNALSLARGARVRAIVSLGGIKAVSIGKAVAALYNEKGDIYSYIEGKQPEGEPLPLVCVPTTCRDPAMLAAGTPVADSRNGQVIHMKTQGGLCRGVVIDPNVYVHIPQNTRRAMLLQAAALAFESFISTKASFFSDAVVAKSLELLFAALGAEGRGELGVPQDELAAEGGLLASLGAAASSPGAATALAIACNARCRTPSSVVSAILLPHVVEDAARSSAEKTLALAKMLGLIGDGGAGVAAAQALREMLDRLGLPARLKDAGLAIEQLAAVAEDASKMEFMSYTPRGMTSDDLFDLAKRAY